MKQPERWSERGASGCAAFHVCATLQGVIEPCIQLFLMLHERDFLDFSQPNVDVGSPQDHASTAP